MQRCGKIDGHETVILPLSCDREKIVLSLVVVLLLQTGKTFTNWMKMLWEQNLEGWSTQLKEK